LLRARTGYKNNAPPAACPRPKIKDVSVIATAPGGTAPHRSQVLTDQDGLYGYGCATYTQRADLVNVAVHRYLRPS
jgi:mannonate dehydratase